MTEPTMTEIESDDDLIMDEQIQYTYVENEIIPMEEEVGEEIEHHHYGLIDREVYERVLDQTEELSGRNWDLALKCREYERDLRISNRSLPTRARDKIRFWKKVAAVQKQKIKKWVKKLFKCTTEDDVYYHRTPQYRGMLESHYYRPEMNPE